MFQNPRKRVKMHIPMPLLLNNAVVALISAILSRCSTVRQRHFCSSLTTQQIKTLQEQQYQQLNSKLTHSKYNTLSKEKMSNSTRNKTHEATAPETKHTKQQHQKQNT